MPNKETHRAFNQLLNTFLEINNKEEELAQDGTSSIKLVPIFLYNDTDKKLKVEFKIGNEQLTKINNLPDFLNECLIEKNINITMCWSLYMRKMLLKSKVGLC